MKMMKRPEEGREMVKRGIVKRFNEAKDYNDYMELLLDYWNTTGIDYMTAEEFWEYAESHELVYQ